MNRRRAGGSLSTMPRPVLRSQRNAGSRRSNSILKPRLKTLAGKGSYALGLPAGSQANAPWQWLPLEWRSL